MIHGPAVKLIALGVFASVIAAALKVSEVTTGCSGGNPAVLSADNVAIDLTDTACAPLENQTAGQPWIDFVCTLIEGGELVISELATPTDAGAAGGDAGARLIAKTRTVRVRVPAGEAPSFMAAHRVGMKGGGAK